MMRKREIDSQGILPYPLRKRCIMRQYLKQSYKL